MVNQRRLHRHWNDIRGQLRQRWGQLTDEDLQLSNGNIDELVGHIQQKTGEAPEVIQQYLEELTGRGANVISRTAGTVGRATRRAAGAVRDGYAGTQHTVRRHPGRSLAVALGAGLAAGFALGLVLCREK